MQGQLVSSLVHIYIRNVNFESLNNVVYKILLTSKSIGAAIKKYCETNTPASKGEKTAICTTLVVCLTEVVNAAITTHYTPTSATWATHPKAIIVVFSIGALPCSTLSAICTIHSPSLSQITTLT